MITEFFISIATSFAGWVGGLFPTWNPPSWMVNVPTQMQDLLQSFNGLGVWVDWTALGLCVGGVIAVYGIGFLIRLSRAVVAHIPFIGGGG